MAIPWLDLEFMGLSQWSSWTYFYFFSISLSESFPILEWFAFSNNSFHHNIIVNTWYKMRIQEDKLWKWQLQINIFAFNYSLANIKIYKPWIKFKSLEVSTVWLLLRWDSLWSRSCNALVLASGLFPCTCLENCDYLIFQTQNIGLES